MKRNKFYPSVFYLAVLISSFTLAVLLLSCKSDTTTGPPGGSPQTNDSLIFEKDSLVLRSTTNDSLHYIFSTVFHDSLRFEFQGLTNIDSSNAYLSVLICISRDSILGFANYFVVYNTFSQLDFTKNHVYYCKNDFSPLVSHFYMGIYNSFSSEPKYIILKNVKIYKIKN